MADLAKSIQYNPEQRHHICAVKTVFSQIKVFVVRIHVSDWKLEEPGILLF